ncbi:MAG TPA: MmcQ/YjbR family DNA-binding protein [Cyclobacteriaceae bacterium]|nr:MmcQ/YjbR family DNA-binding protein [Cyclobacteriaceae bacterium]
MNIESFRTYCLSKPGVTEETPFGPDVLVMKVMGKMFALTDLNTFAAISLKVVPEVGAELREQYTSVVEAYHLNKKHWMSVVMDGGVGDKLVKGWIDGSYELVVKGLTKKEREKLKK